MAQGEFRESASEPPCGCHQRPVSAGHRGADQGMRSD